MIDLLTDMHFVPAQGANMTVGASTSEVGLCNAQCTVFSLTPSHSYDLKKNRFKCRNILALQC